MRGERQRRDDDDGDGGGGGERGVSLSRHQPHARENKREELKRERRDAALKLKRGEQKRKA